MTRARDGSIFVGAVAYHERVVVIWEAFRNYFLAHGVPVDYVLYSNYERLVDALIGGEVDIAWNTNPAYVRARHIIGAGVQILGMRDIDAAFSSIIVTRRGEGIEKPQELAGARLALGSRDSGHAAILPLYFLAREGLNAAEQCSLVRFDTDLGKHGDTGDSELRVVRAVAADEADAGALGGPTWARFRAEALPAASTLEVVWRSPAYFHCNFSALPSFDAKRARRWREALLAMDYEDPAMRHAMDLEGVKRWLPGDESGYRTLEEAMAQQGYLP